MPANRIGTFYTEKIASLRDLSWYKTDDKIEMPGYAFEGTVHDGFRVFDFESLMEDRYGPAGDYINRPCRCDGCYQTGDGGNTLVEFKRKTCDKVQLHRKLYDSLIALVEYAGCVFATLRKSTVYLIVNKEGCTNQSAREQLANRKSHSIQKPWKVAHYRCERANLYKQEGVTIRKAYELTPTQFSKYIEDLSWHSL